MSLNRIKDKEQIIQELEYEIPYHYLPTLSDGYVKQHRYWGWGYRYLSGMELIFSILKAITFKNLIDVGCGDGRFLRELHRKWPKASLLGVDYSKNVINLAKALNPHLNFECLDITQAVPDHPYDVVTSIEVLEHIPPEYLPEFVAALAGLTHQHSRLLITVPHANQPLLTKHYQHFTAESLETYLTRLCPILLLGVGHLWMPKQAVIE